MLEGNITTIILLFAGFYIIAVIVERIVEFFISGGTKPLHDVILIIEKAKPKK